MNEKTGTRPSPADAQEPTRIPPSFWAWAVFLTLAGVAGLAGWFGAYVVTALVVALMGAEGWYWYTHRLWKGSTPRTRQP